MRRRGQILSLDAMFSLVLVIMILGMISTTSTAMKNEITTMIGWYERSNIGDTMLDIITKTPGDPDNWETDPSKLKQLGLENPNYPDTLDYDKVEALNESYQNNDETLKEILSNLSMGKDFSLSFFLTKVEIDGDVTVQEGAISSNLVIKYIYATEVVHADYNITLINGEFVDDPDEIKASIERSPWVIYSERRMPMSKMVYANRYTITPSDIPKEMYVGTLTTTVPDYMTFKIAFSDPGYVVLVAWLRGTNVSGYSVLAAYRTEEDTTMKAIINQTINGNNVVRYYSSQSPDYIIIPWNDFLTTVKQGEKLDIYVWVYKMSDVNVMEFEDLNGINTLMKPQVSPTVLKLRVWDDS